MSFEDPLYEEFLESFRTMRALMPDYLEAKSIFLDQVRSLTFKVFCLWYPIIFFEQSLFDYFDDPKWYWADVSSIGGWWYAWVVIGLLCIARSLRAPLTHRDLKRFNFAWDYFAEYFLPYQRAERAYYKLLKQVERARESEQKERS